MFKNIFWIQTETIFLKDFAVFKKTINMPLPSIS